MKRAIAHKDYDVRGGGEVLARKLTEAFDAPMYVGRRNHSNEPDDKHLDIREIPLSKIDKWAIDRGGVSRTAAYALRWQAAGEHLQDYDTVITSGNEPLWYVPPEEQTLIAYTHSTPRFMYDLYNDETDFSGIMGRVKSLFYTAQRTVYESNVRRPDYWIANSELVARRINRYWNIPESQIEVVYPPVQTQGLSPENTRTQDRYLYFGRLAGHKRVDSIISAWDEEMPQLIIAGTGPELESLESMAPSNVRFEGYVSETRKAELLSSAKALLYPCQNEDFGMVPIESMASGTPVIGVREGFTQYQIQHAKNGVRYEHGNLKEAVRLFEEWGVSWSEQEITEFATEHFGEERFKEEMREIVERVEEQTEVSPEWCE